MGQRELKRQENRGQENPRREKKKRREPDAAKSGSMEIPGCGGESVDIKSDPSSD
ncbi:hypothetical protein TBK1r_05220 [Stieleria magnilauensis]|uniref:Uncharacterized protein n=1 Tax=Stieleria magnilauensis TaxID=2527963 RepID=A0ABX5XHY9_9BACT|nr:hypothetical protein TBK1r_05220 [Planctomycetes bacterium TBK1r]